MCWKCCKILPNVLFYLRFATAGGASAVFADQIIATLLVGQLFVDQLLAPLVFAQRIIAPLVPLILRSQKIGQANRHISCVNLRPYYDGASPHPLESSHHIDFVTFRPRHIDTTWATNKVIFSLNGTIIRPIINRPNSGLTIRPIFEENTY